MVAPVNLLLFGPPMAGKDLAIWVIEEVVENLPIWQRTWNAIQLAKENNAANYPPAAVIFTPAASDANPSPEAYIYSFVASSGSIYYQTYNGTEWTSNPSALVSCPSAAGAAVFGDSLWVFYRDDSNALFAITSADGTNWSTPQSIFGPLTGMIQNNPWAVTFNDALYVFYQGDGADSGYLCYTFTGDGKTWNDSARVPNTGTTGSSSNCVAMSTSPGAAAFTPSPTLPPFGVWQTNDGSAWSLSPNLSSPSLEGNLYVFHQGANNNQQIRYNVMDISGNWQGDTQISGASMQGQPTPYVYNEELYVAYDQGGKGGALMYMGTTDGVGWCEPIQISSISLSNSPALAIMNDQLFCLMMGPNQDQRLWCSSTGSDGQWGLMYWNYQGILLAQNTSPGAVQFNNQIYCFYQSVDSNYKANGSLYYTIYTQENTWNSGAQLLAGETSGNIMTCSPAPVVFGDNLYVFFQGSGSNEGQMQYMYSGDGNDWSSLQSVPDTSMSLTPSPVVFKDNLYVFHTRSGNIWFNTMDSTGSWSGDTEITAGLGHFATDNPLVAVVYDGSLYVFYPGEKYQVYYIKSTSEYPDASSWSEPLCVPNTMVNCRDVNGQTCQFFTVIEEPNGQLSVYFQGVDDNSEFGFGTHSNGYLYSVSTTDPGSGGTQTSGYVGYGQGNWSPTTQVGVMPPDHSPPAGLANVANMVVAVVAQNPLWAE